MRLEFYLCEICQQKRTFYVSWEKSGGYGETNVRLCCLDARKDVIVPAGKYKFRQADLSGLAFSF